MDVEKNLSINKDDFHDPTSRIVKAILTLYSMETFLVYNLNTASRT